MNWYEFIFSEKRSFRLLRHLLFWLLWWIYFILSFYHYEQSGLQRVEFEPWSFNLFIKSILLLCIHITACYYFINYVMPHYFFKRKYAGLAGQILFLSIFILFSCYFLHKTIFPLINNEFNYTPIVAEQNTWWASISAGLLSAPKVISAAAVIILLKRWWLQQKEKERLEREKLITDLQLLKAQMHPDFLFSSLDNIYLMMQKKDKPSASMLLLKLADILSYILYECDNKLVLLEKEIKAIKDYLQLEKNRMKDKLELHVAIRGYPGNKMIAPLILFSFIECSFLHVRNKSQEMNWINLDIEIQPNEIAMKLIHGKNTPTSTFSEIENAITKITKSLNFFYGSQYDLKTTIDGEIMIIYLRIMLKESIEENEPGIFNNQKLTYAAI